MIVEGATLGEAVYLDCDSPYSGTAFPSGTLKRPVNNLKDALKISDRMDIPTIISHGPIVLEDKDYLVANKMIKPDEGENVNFIFPETEEFISFPKERLK